MTATAAPRPKGSRNEPGSGKWRGPTREYDLLKEFTVALVVVALLTTVLAVLFSSPDEHAITLQSWAKAAPNDFVATAVAELSGESGSASYGPPYNSASEGQAIGPLKLQKWAGVRIPVDPPNDFVITPLSTRAGDPAVQAALAQWKGASAEVQTKWATDYGEAVGKAPDGDPTKVEKGDYGPVPALSTALLGMATSGALDSQLVNPGSGFYQTDFTKPLLFLADGGYLEETAGGSRLQGGQWGMMNETGNYPGQAWLWLYTFWYQIPPFTTEGSAWADNADAIIWAIMMVASLILVLVPFIPGLRSIPRKVGIYRLVWRDYSARFGAERGR
jgi:hypothetical protein